MTTQVLQPLPWKWFDFLQPPRPLAATPPTVDAGGADRVYQVTVDGRIIPFKFLRRPGPDRKLLVMLHGMGLTIGTFRGVSPYLFESHDLALIDYSSLSCEVSGWPMGGVAVKAMTESVWAVADAIGIEKMSLAGNSLGGAMCLVAALSRPQRIEKMVLANPACYPQHLPFMYRVARIPLIGEVVMGMMKPGRLIEGIEYIGYVDKGRFDPELRNRYLNVMIHCRNRYRLMEMIRHLPGGPREVLIAAHLNRLHEITQPVLVTWGLCDPLLIAGAGERLAKELGNSLYQPYPDLAHMPHEEAPDRVGPAWARFLNEIDLICH